MDTKKDLALLESTLDIYGADRARWPEDIRARLAAFADVNVAAHKLIEREMSFEKALSAASDPDNRQLAMLTDRIVARVGDDRSNIIQWPGASRPETASQSPQVGQKVRRQPGSKTSVAALLAASLVVGVFAGSMDFIKPIAQSVADSIGIVADIDEDSDAVVVALLDDNPELTEWDVQ